MVAVVEPGVGKNPPWKAGGHDGQEVGPFPWGPTSPQKATEQQGGRLEEECCNMNGLKAAEASVSGSRVLLQPHWSSPTVASAHTAQGRGKVAALSGNQARLSKPFWILQPLFGPEKPGPRLGISTADHAPHSHSSPNYEQGYVWAQGLWPFSTQECSPSPLQAQGTAMPRLQASLGPL